jgi:hypothetical protein
MIKLSQNRNLLHFADLCTKDKLYGKIMINIYILQ